MILSSGTLSYTGTQHIDGFETIETLTSPNTILSFTEHGVEHFV
jgi:hypothetical protein